MDGCVWNMDCVIGWVISLLMYAFAIEGGHFEHGVVV